MLEKHKCGSESKGKVKTKQNRKTSTAANIAALSLSEKETFLKGARVQ